MKKTKLRLAVLLLALIAGLSPASAAAAPARAVPAAAEAALTESGDAGPGGDTGGEPLHIYISPYDVTLEAGSKKTLTVQGTGLTDDLEYEWASSDLSIADMKGSRRSATLLGIGAGTTTITVTVHDRARDLHATDQIAVTVTGQKLRSYWVYTDIASLRMEIGDEQTVTAECTGDRTWTGYKWTSSNSSVAKVTGTGASATIEACGAGIAEITVEAADWANSDKATVRVAVRTEDELEIRTDPAACTLAAGASLKVTTSGPAEDDKLTYTWTSSDNTVASVTGSGSKAVVIANAPGDAEIVVSISRPKDESTARAVLPVSVVPRYDKLTVTRGEDASLSLRADREQALRAAVSGGSGNYTFLWEASGSVTILERARDRATVKAENDGPGRVTLSVTDDIAGSSAFVSWFFNETPPAAGPSPAPAADTAPASGSGTAPASGSGTAPASGSGTAPASGSGTAPASGSGTAPASGSGTAAAPAAVTVPAIPADQIGKAAGSYYATDIKTMVNGTAIEAINAGGRTLISAEDLRTHGFRVLWDGEARKLSIGRGGAETGSSGDDNDGSGSGGPSVMSSDQAAGTRLGDYFYTDIVTELDGTPIGSYNTGGRTWICAEDMRAYGYDVLWDPDARSLTVTAR